MRPVFVAGVGTRPFGRWPDESFEDVSYPAVSAALADANAPFPDIGMAFCGVANSSLYDSRRVVQQFGWTGIMIHSVAQASGSSAAAFRLAYWTVGAGIVDSCLVVGYEKSLGGMLSGTLQPGTRYLDVLGVDPIPARLGLEMRKRMRDYDEPIEAYASVAVQASYYSSRNPNAHMRQELTLDDVLQSPPISDPLTLHMCCPVSDGAAAAVICSEDQVAQWDVAVPIEIVAAACGSPDAGDLVSGPGADIGGDFKTGRLTRRLAAELYERAGVGPDDIDVAQMHDPFAFATLVDLEALGFCAEGEAGRFVMDGGIAPTGRIPTNTDGGLLRKGHALGATGVSQIAEVVKQLRGDGGERQVPGDPRIGLTHSSGAGMLNMHLLRRP